MLFSLTIILAATILTSCRKEEEKPIHTHTEVTIPAKSETCTETGLTEGKKCSVCGEIIASQKIIPAKGHTEEVIPGKEATCTESGLTEGKKCSVCGKITVPGTVIIAKAHTYENGICKDCGYVKNQSEGLKLTLNSDNQSYTVSGIGTCKDTDIIIPSNYDGKPITGIGSSAFCKHLGVTSVTIPHSVTSIGDEAFRECLGLTIVNIPDSVTSIGEGAFRECQSLTSVKIPDSVTSIGDEAFYKCKNLTRLTIPDSVTYIGSGALSACDKLTYNIFDNGNYLGNERNPYAVLVKAKDRYITSNEVHGSAKVICEGAFF